MKKTMLPVMLLTIFGCAEEPVRRELERPEWEITNVQLPERNGVRFSGAHGGELYVQFPHSLISIDTAMNIRTVRKSDAEAQNIPMPALANGIYCVSELERYVVQARRADTVRVHFIDLNSDARLSLNLTTLRKQLGLSYNFGYDGLVVSINSGGTVFILVDSGENDAKALYGITYQLHSAMGKIELSDRRLLRIGTFEGYPSLSSSGSVFYLTTGANRYRIDGEHVTQLGKDEVTEGTGMGPPGSLLGFHKGNFYYGASNCENPVYYTADMKNVSTVLIYNDDDKCFTRLGVMNGYLYSFDEQGILFRVKL